MPAKYALIDGQEVTLKQVIPHVTNADAICVFVGLGGHDCYVSEAEWEEGALRFAAYARQSEIVTSESRGSAKLALFKSLFKGRQDTYAHGYKTKQGGIGYAPTCANERTSSCPRWNGSQKGMRCATCRIRALTPLDDRQLIAHFRGEYSDHRDIVGMYVLLSDCTTWLLAADFDKKGWQREAALYRDVCREHGFCPAVERSRSGQGAHVWLFFEEPIAGSLARNLGCLLLTEAMERCPDIGFGSYDRLFPTQDTIDEGGFGNLIALPLQGQAKKQHNSVFVDDSFVEYPDQWRYLCTIRRATAQQVRELVGSAVDGPLGDLAFSRRDGRAPRVSVAQALMSASDSGKTAQDVNEAVQPTVFPTVVRIIKRNMLYVSKEGLPPAVENRIRRLAAFSNPEFYRAQARHQSVYGKPRIIWCGEDDERSIMLPRGCEQKLVRLVESQGCSCAIDDQRNIGRPIRVEFVGMLQPRQQKAAEALLRHENGVLSAPPGFGKTVIGAYLIAKLKMRTLVIVSNTELVGQWKDRVASFLRIVDNRPPQLTKSGKPSKRRRPTVGQIGAGRNSPSGIVDIATFQSLTTKDDLGAPCAKRLVEEYELVICDECHHAGAPSLELVMKSVCARRVYGLSATPKRPDGLEGILFLHCGPVRYKVDPKEQAVEQGFSRILIPRFTHIRLAGLEEHPSFNQVVDLLCAHASRNQLIVDDACDAIQNGRLPLIITRRREHASGLSELLTAKGIETYLLTGKGSPAERRERMELARSATGPFAIVATGSYLGEGFDLPALDTLMLAAPYSWEGVITQYSGRIHRASEGKTEVKVYDYVDTSIPMLERMYKRRLKTFVRLGYEVEEESIDAEYGTRIVERGSWQGEFLADLEQAQRRVLISAPYCNKKLVQTLCGGFKQAVDRGVEVRVIVRRPTSEVSQTLQSDALRLLRRAGCQVAQRESPLTGVAVFDDARCWYGSLPLLAYARADDCSLRIESAEVASDLLGLCEVGVAGDAASEKS